MNTEDGFYFSAGGKVLMGKVGTEDETILESRSLTDIGAETVLGYQFNNFIFGLGAEYNFWQQQTKASEVANTNLSGSQTQFSAVLGYRWAPITVIGKYYFISDYKMSKGNAAGQKAEYSQPASAFSAQLLYNFSGSSHLGLEYNSGQYKKQKIGSIENDLSAAAKLNVSAVGVVYVWIY